MSELYPEMSGDRGRDCGFCVWLGVLAHLSRRSRRVAWGGVLLVPVFILADSAIDFLFFNEAGAAFPDVLLHPEPRELYMRLLFSLLFAAFGVYAAVLLDRAEGVEGGLRALQEQLERQAQIDPLTGAFNRRKFHEVLEVSISNAVRYRHRFALLMMDIDHFKLINDRFGHQAGDGVLADVCDLIALSVRNLDPLFRIGGEEFCLVTTVDAKGNIRPLAEKIRRVVEAHRFPGVGSVTLCIGVAHFREGDTRERIYARADAALYEAKKTGRNCVVSDDA